MFEIWLLNVVNWNCNDPKKGNWFATAKKSMMQNIEHFTVVSNTVTLLSFCLFIFHLYSPVDWTHTALSHGDRTFCPTPFETSLLAKIAGSTSCKAFYQSLGLSL